MKIDKKKHWTSVYLHKSPFDVSWYQNKPSMSLEFILSTNLCKDSAIIDVGGGTSNLVDNLIEVEFKNLSVLDISGNALRITKDRLGPKGRNINWFVSDIIKFDSPNKFSLWHDRAVFHFLTNPSDRTNYINVLKNKLKSDGHLIIATFAIGGPQKCSGLDIVQYDYEKIKKELGDDFILVKQRIDFHITPSDKMQKFIYFHFRRNC